MIRNHLRFYPAARVRDVAEGAIVVDGEVVGTWRPRTSGRKLTVHADLWRKLPRLRRAELGEQVERLAAHRQVTLAALQL